MNDHNYSVTIQWTGNNGTGTSAYREFERSHIISAGAKSHILASSDPAFRGDRTKYNPEELFIASLSSCHMLWYLHLCSEAGIIVTAYTDRATGIMVVDAKGGGHFTEVILNPVVAVMADVMTAPANALHKTANELCFIAKSVNCKVRHNPTCSVDAQEFNLGNLSEKP